MLALSVSAALHTTSTNAGANSSGMAKLQPSADETQRAVLSMPRVYNSVTTGNAPTVARAPARTTSTSVLDVENRITELRAVLEARKLKALTPYHPDAWLRVLTKSRLIHTYPHIPHSLQFGFLGSIPPISITYTPANNYSVTEHADAFKAILSREFEAGRYLGPLSRSEMESLIGPFQTAPLSLIPKLGKPGKFRLIQNLSHSPSSPLRPIQSINSSIDSNIYPCTYGTFSTICLLVWRLPPGSEGATRDVAEAYRTIPLHPSQYAGLIVRTGEDNFAIDTCFCFGCSSAAGSYGGVADAGADILRSEGIGPISKWVDDHLFIRILREHIQRYNEQREIWAHNIQTHGGLHINGGRKWYRGTTLPDDHSEEYDEDCSFPIKDFSQRSPRSLKDAQFSCCLDDINFFSAETGTPWEPSKDVPFSPHPPFTGFTWNLDARTVEIPTSKKQKYLAAIATWESRPRHTLFQVRSLYGKLAHASLVVPAGRAYLTELEAMLSLFSDRPLVPHTPPHACAADLRWWSATLQQPSVSRPIPGPCEVLDLNAFSDASSGMGVAIWINGQWRAWRLIPGWKADNRDIGWAEAIGFEFLVLAIIQSHGPTSNPHFKVYGDNRGVVEGWWKGRSRNRATNSVFKRIHLITSSAACSVLTRYIPSAHNPADDPSRGKYPPRSLLLPPLPIHPAIRNFIIDFDAPILPSERPQSHNSSIEVHAPPKVRVQHEYARQALSNRQLERQGEELLKAAQA
jgi:hypothetical protein